MINTVKETWASLHVCSGSLSRDRNLGINIISALTKSSLQRTRQDKTYGVTAPLNVRNPLTCSEVVSSSVLSNDRLLTHPQPKHRRQRPSSRYASTIAKLQIYWTPVDLGCRILIHTSTGCRRRSISDHQAIRRGEHTAVSV